MKLARQLRLAPHWTEVEVCSDNCPVELVLSPDVGAVLQGGVSSAQPVKAGTWPLGSLATDQQCADFYPASPLRSVILAAPERPDREDLPKYDRAALLDVVGGKVTLTQGDGVVARLQLGGVAWLTTPLRRLPLDPDIMGQGDSQIGYRRSGNLVFLDGVLPKINYSQEDTVICALPQGCQPKGGRRWYLSVCFEQGYICFLRFFLDSAGFLSACRSHLQGRARDGHSYTVQQRNLGPVAASLSSVRFLLTPGTPLELLAGAKPPKQHAARKHLAYLGLQDGLAPAAHGENGAGVADELDGFQVASCHRQGHLVLLDGAVLLSSRHRYTPFARLPEDCRPDQRVTLLVARSPPRESGDRLTLERLDILPDGECICPQLPEGAGAEHAVHLSGAVFGVPVRAQDPAEDPAALSSLGCTQGSKQREESPASTWKRFQELEERDRRFRNKFQTIAEFQQFERTLQWFRAHDCTESHRLTHSCFKGRSDFTQTGMLVFDTEEDLEGLNKAIAWLYDRRIPVVLMERQTRIFPLIFDMDLKVTSQDMLNSVPMRIKRTRPWRGRVDFSRWHGADHFVLSKDMLLLRHLGMIVFQFFPDLPLIDFCIFNASGWDRVKDLVKVSLHLVAPYVLVTPDRLTAIRERMLEYLGECSEVDGHPLADLLQTYLDESEDNTWEKVVDQTVTSGTNGLRMPYCDKAQRILKREFVDRKRRGEVFTERQLMDLHAYLKEEAGRPCLPEGILRLIPAKHAEDENALPEAKWMCKGDDLPIDEWIRLGRCRYAWRLPLAPPGPTPWRPPLRYQWVEPVPLWEDRTQLKGSPVVRKFSGSAAEFRSNWEEALSRSPTLSGRWLISSIDARWRGGLQDDSTHEVRYIVRASRVVLLLSPEVGAALAFTELRKVLAGWTEPDDFLCVPICGSPSDSHSSALHTIVAPSAEFPTLQAALNAVPSDEPLHRVLVRCGTHELPATLCIERPVLLEGEGRWETTLRAQNKAVIRLQGPGAHRAMVRNLRVEVYGNGQGGAAVEMDGTEGEAAVVGCHLAAEGTWGTCVWARGGSPQIVRNFVARARWGVVLIGTGGRVEDNSIRGLGEAGLVLVGGSTWVHRNHIADCGGPAILAAMDCRAVLQENDIRECLSGVRIIGKQSEIQMRTGNRLLHNGLCDEHQVEAPPGVIPSGATSTVRSCRPFSFLPKDTQELLKRMRTCREHAELAILMRSARRRGLLAQAYHANRRLTKLRKAAHKAPAPRAPPAKREIVVVGKAWDGPGLGFGEQCISVLPGELCEVLRRDASGWILLSTSRHSRGWCSPHVLG